MIKMKKEKNSLISEVGVQIPMLKTYNNGILFKNEPIMEFKDEIDPASFYAYLAALPEKEMKKKLKWFSKNFSDITEY